MKTGMSLFSRSLTSDALDGRVGQFACTLAGIALVPTAIVALVRHPGNRAEFFFGVGLAIVAGFLCVMLGMLCRHNVAAKTSITVRSRVIEFASYAGAVTLLVGGILWVPTFAPTAAGVTLALLLICTLSLTAVLFGMMTSALARRANGGV